MKVPVCKEQKRIFNLIADLVQDCIALKDYEKLITACYSTASEEEEYNRVNSFLKGYNSVLQDAVLVGIDDKICVSIREWCKKRNKVLTYKMMLAEIDKHIIYESVFDVWEEQVFESLNDNNESILIELNDFSTKTQWGDRCRKTAYTWSDPFNECLRNVFIVKREALKEEMVESYQVKNYMIQGLFPADTSEVAFGVSPLINTDGSKLMNIEYSHRQSDDGSELCVFSISGILDKDRIRKAVCKAYHLASLNQADILVMPEMLGYPELCDPEEDSEYNLLLRTLVKQHKRSVYPRVILMPTCWHNKENILRVYTRDGKLLLSQRKQHSFKFYPEGSREMFSEDLFFEKDINGVEKREICILHIHRVGRIAFPICVDYLNSRFRDILVEDLRAHFLLCPSYTPGNANFELSSTASLEYGVRTVWCNTCSACYKKEGSIPDYVGAICIPSIGTANPLLRLEPKKEQCCQLGCIFKVSIPLNCANQENRREDLIPKYEHVILSAE